MTGGKCPRTTIRVMQRLHVARARDKRGFRYKNKKLFTGNYPAWPAAPEKLPICKVGIKIKASASCACFTQWILVTTLIKG